MVGLPGCKSTLVAHVQLFIHQHPYIFVLRSAHNSFISQSILILLLPLPRCRTLHLVLLNLVRFTLNILKNKLVLNVFVKALKEVKNHSISQLKQGNCVQNTVKEHSR